MRRRFPILAVLPMLALLASACGASTQAPPPIIVSSTPIAGYGGVTSTPPSAAVIPATGGTDTPTALPAIPTPTRAYFSGLVPTPQALPTAPLNALVIEIKMAVNAQYGSILVDGQGRTLYLYTGDDPLVSTCYGTCTQTWLPAVPYGRKPSVLPGIDPTKLKSIVRADGTRQVTYNGWPLYYYSGDVAPGQTNGQGSGGKWYVVSVNGDPVR